MGTRRKARECALQILFAADVAQTPENMLAHDYWGEFGFDEIFRGANTLAVSVLDEIGRFDALAIDAKALVKKINALSNVRRLFSDLEDILSLNGKVKKSYRDFIEGFINGEIPETEVVGGAERPKPPQIEVIYDSIREVEKRFNDLFFNITLEIKNLHKSFTENEDKLVEELGEQNRQISRNLIESLLPKISAMIGEIHPTRVFANSIALETLRNIKTIDERIRSRAEHWRISRMAIVDRNVLRLAVCEFLFELTPDKPTPHTVVINEALEIARRFSTFEATQFINGILDAIKHDLEKHQPQKPPQNGEELEKTKTSSP